jgi:hypothetical protein
MTALDKASPASVDETKLACARPDPRALSLGIGGIRLTVASQSRDLLLDVPSPAHQFLVDSPVNGESPDESADGCTIEASWGAIPAAAPGDLVFDSGGLWQQFSDGSGSRGTGHVFRFRSSFYGPLPYKECRVDADFRHARVVLSRDYLDCGQPVYPIEYPLDEILMLNLLSQSRGIDVHACGIEDSDGRGYLFLGQSGAGKTTTARLWDAIPGIRILSDDRIILRFVDGCLRMYGTPWHGEGQFASAPGARLDHIYFLGRGPMNEATPMAPTEAVARLMACSFVPFHDRAGLEFTLEFLQQVTRAVPVAELRFVPDGRVRDFIRSGNR